MIVGRVYVTFTGPLPRRARLWAALLRAGRGALLSHLTAAELQGLTDRPSRTIHVTIPASRRVRPMPGVVLHTSSAVGRSAHPTRRPPQTRIEETVLDLTEQSVDLDEAMGWLSRACGRRLTTADRLLRAIGGRAKLRWRRELRAAPGQRRRRCR